MGAWEGVWAAVMGLGAGALLGLAAWRAARAVLVRAARRTETGRDDMVLARLAGPGRAAVVLLAMGLAAEAVRPLLGAALGAGVGQLLGVAWTLALAWLAARGVLLAEDLVLARFDLGARDNLRARKLHTQVRVANRILGVALALVVLALVCMRFETFRQLGAGILASAGVAGLVVGLAAQKTIANALAGIQLAFTQPIRLDDVVVIEGEWGRIEEITFTYVVVRIWDQRRLIVPVARFLDAPFQNWTRVSAEVWGAVFLYADPTVPVPRVREELARYVSGHPKWDGKVCGLQVTGASERALELRALVSAADSPDLWDLRCDVREHLAAFLRDELPGSLPRTRAQLSGELANPAGEGYSRG
ncbi:MAG: mechanosensitive ion channel domain-containing protein [Thermodesulfobacteriota bacterium]